MYHFQERPLTANVETLSMAFVNDSWGHCWSIHSLDHTALHRDKRLEDNELMDQSNLTWSTYVQYNQYSFRFHCWMCKEKVMEITIFLRTPYHLLVSLVPTHWDPVHKDDKSDMAAANIPVPWKLLGEKPKLQVPVLPRDNIVARIHLGRQRYFGSHTRFLWMIHRWSLTDGD